MEIRWKYTQMSTYTHRADCAKSGKSMLRDCLVLVVFFYSDSERRGADTCSLSTLYVTRRLIYEKVEGALWNSLRLYVYTWWKVWSCRLYFHEQKIACPRNDSYNSEVWSFLRITAFRVYLFIYLYYIDNIVQIIIMMQWLC